MKEKVLITGINGFLGSYIAKGLKDNYEVIGLEYSTKNLFRLVNELFKVYESSDDLSIIFEENSIYAIIHVATVYRSEDSVSPLLNTNMLLPVRLLELANKFGVKSFLNTDSFFNSEKQSYSYLSEYTLSKKQSLEWLKLISKSCKLINMKIFHMYGSGDALTKFIPKITKDIQSNSDVIQLTSGTQKRDFIHVKDVVSAYKTVLARLDDIDNFTEFEVGTGRATSIREIVSLIKELSGSTSKLDFGALPTRDGEIMFSQAKNQTLLDLNWIPKITLEEGVLITLSDN